MTYTKQELEQMMKKSGGWLDLSGTQITALPDMNGSIVQFLISTHNDAGVMTWGTLRTIGGTVLQLHTLSNPTVASITFPQINNGLVDTVTEL